MCKAVDKEMSIGPFFLKGKSGGKSGHFIREESGIMLKISPTLDPWNHINFPFSLFSEIIQNFSINLFLSSFFFKILIIIITGEIIINKKTVN